MKSIQKGKGSFGNKNPSILKTSRIIHWRTFLHMEPLRKLKKMGPFLGEKGITVFGSNDLSSKETSTSRSTLFLVDKGFQIQKITLFGLGFVNLATALPNPLGVRQIVLPIEALTELFFRMDKSKLISGLLRLGIR